MTEAQLGCKYLFLDFHTAYFLKQSIS